MSKGLKSWNLSWKTKSLNNMSTYFNESGVTIIKRPCFSSKSLSSLGKEEN